MDCIRRAQLQDAVRLAEIEVFNYRINFYPIFRSDEFYFDELSVPAKMAEYAKDDALLARTYVYDDGVVKGFVRVCGREVEKLFVEPVLQGSGIGAALLGYAEAHHAADHLWALEKNHRAIAFYERHGFRPTGERKLEEDTEEYLILMAKNDPSERS